MVNFKIFFFNQFFFKYYNLALLKNDEMYEILNLQLQERKGILIFYKNNHHYELDFLLCLK
jgi:hypothetical protein